MDVRAAVEEISGLVSPGISKAVGRHRGVLVINLPRGCGKPSAKVIKHGDRVLTCSCLIARTDLFKLAFISFGHWASAVHPLLDLALKRS